MGWATFDEARGFTEVERLLEGQWDDGLVPQIVFHAPSDDYFPGPAVWGVDHTPPTSGITQPPVLASAVRHMLERSQDRAAAEARVAAIYPRLVAYHRWWQRARDPNGSGLVSTLHPWETGMDNSPAWDAALARVPAATITAVQRRDTTHVNATMRPRAEEYQRFIHLVDLFRDVRWQPEKMLAASPFRVADIGTTLSCCVPNVTCRCSPSDLANWGTVVRLLRASNACDQRSKSCGTHSLSCSTRLI